MPFQPSPTSPSLAARRPASPYPAQTSVFPNTPLTHQTRRHRSLPPQCCSFTNSCRLVQSDLAKSKKCAVFFFHASAFTMPPPAETGAPKEAAPAMDAATRVVLYTKVRPGIARPPLACEPPTKPWAVIFFSSGCNVLLLLPASPAAARVRASGCPTRTRPGGQRLCSS